METVKIGDLFTFLKSFDQKDTLEEYCNKTALPMIPAGSVGTVVEVNEKGMILEIPDPWAPGKPAADLKKYRCWLYRKGEQWVAWNNVVANITKYLPLDLGHIDEHIDKPPWDEGGFESPYDVLLEGG